jgi:uncharacterized protein (DUF697 family)
MKITKSQLRQLIKEEIMNEINEVRYSGNQLERRDEVVKAMLEELGLDGNENTDKATYGYTYTLRSVAKNQNLNDKQLAALKDPRFAATTKMFMEFKKELEAQDADPEIIFDTATMLTKEAGNRLSDEDDLG